ncbi:DedA family protein [Natrinema salaciae]|uniref:Membrane protein DedA, SNARE-associated domain n=1 Tax=Natrinema salaciae TaxID=1186196 RepID=A0A1H9MGB6_9EURY|nr:VTT domain-containing protein [Natrinema salaciae]SER22549.1 membrane protein DedA, SNARE-associated domain [Natrinema salaciae]
MVDFAIDLGPAAVRFIRLYGPLALLIFTFLETSMLFPFFPSEVVVPAAAALLIVDPLSFVVFVTAATVGGTVGAYVPYYAFRGPGSRGLGRLRERINVSEEAAERGRRWFRRWGQSSVFWGRFLPALRSVVSIPAGLAGMPAARFGVYTAAGTLLFYAAVGAVVYYGRQRSLFAAAGSVAADRPVLTAAVAAVALLTGFLIVTRSRRRERTT